MSGSPQFTKVGKLGWGVLTAANTAYDGTGTVLTLLTASGTGGDLYGGDFVQRIRLKALGTNVATVARIFVNNGSANSSAANNSLIEEVTLASTTASNTTGLYPYDVVLNLWLPPAYKILCTLGTAVSAGWQFTAIGGVY
jgi:hypothetical protein